MINSICLILIGFGFGCFLTKIFTPVPKIEPEKDNFPEDFDPLKTLRENESLKQREESYKQENKLLWERLKEETQFFELLEKALKEGDLDFIKYELKKRSLLKQKLICVSGACSTSGFRITGFSGKK